MTQAKAKRKTAIHKCKLADANFREAVLKAKLCCSQALHAKHILDETEHYLDHVNWTIQRSKFRCVLSKPSDEVTTAVDSRHHGTAKGTQTISEHAWTRATEHTLLVNHFVNIPGGSMAITLD